MNKKLTKILSIALLTVCAFMLMFSQKIDNVSAQTNCEDCVAVIGFGEYCATPDTAEINFTLVSNNSSVDELFSQTNQKLEDIKNAVAEIDQEASNNIVKKHSSVYPVFHNSSVCYEHRVTFELKTTNLDVVDSIIVKLNNSGAYYYGDVCYTLSNTSEAYINALKDAKQNAIDKANALQSGLVLDKLIEESVFCCTRSDSSSICIQARVKAIFECEEIDNAVEDTETQPEVQDNSENFETEVENNFENLEQDVESSVENYNLNTENFEHNDESIEEYSEYQEKNVDYQQSVEEQYLIEEQNNVEGIDHNIA